MSGSDPKLCTIVELSALFGVNSRTMRTWLEGLDPDVPGGAGRGNSAKWILPRVITHKYAIRDSGEALDLNAERARLAKEQADKLAMENDVTRSNQVSIEVAAQEYERAISELVAFLDSLPAQVMRSLPHLSQIDQTRLRRVIVDGRNQFALHGHATDAGQAGHDSTASQGAAGT